MQESVASRPCSSFLSYDVGRGRASAVELRLEPEGLGEAEQRLFQDRYLQPVGDRRALFVRMDEVSLAQDAEVSRHRGLGQGKLVGQLAGRHRVTSQELKDTPAARVGQGLEDSVHDSIFSIISN